MVTTLESILNMNLQDLPENPDKRTCMDALNKINREISRVQNRKSRLKNEPGNNHSQTIVGLGKDLEDLEALKTKWESRLKVAPVN